LKGLQMQCRQVAVGVVDLVKIMHLWRLTKQLALEGVATSAQPLQGRAGQRLGEGAAKGGFDDGHGRFQI
jgi:hypothetical protein